MSRTKLSTVAGLALVLGIVAAVVTLAYSAEKGSGGDPATLQVSGPDGAGYHASRPWGGYTDLDTLASQAHLVVIARVSSQDQIWVDENIIVTESKMVVTSAMKGDVGEGDRISVRQTGGRDRQGIIREVEDDPLMELGAEYLLFLWELDGIPYVWAGPEGRFVVSSDQIVALSDWYTARPIHDTGISGVSITDVAAIVAQHPEVVEPDRSALE